MKATVIKRLNKRNYPSAEGNIPLSNPLEPGDIIEVVEEVKGTVVIGTTNDTWFKTDKGYFVWSGGVSLNLEDPLFLQKLDLDKKTKLPGVLKPYDSNDFWWIKNYGIDKIWEMGITGRGVKIAVLDEGLRLPHPDLPLLPKENFVDITGNDRQTEDRYSHGTHVFGILAASNNGLGVKGICFNSDFYFAKVHDFNIGYKHKYLISAILWAIEKKVDIISISQGSITKKEKDLRLLNECIDRAIELKIAIFCAAGNEGGNTINKYPAKISKHKKIFSVGHVNAEKRPTNVTVLDNSVSIFAPGFNIISTGLKNTNLYFPDSGSSMATPYVAGITSLILEQKRKIQPKYTALEATELLLLEADTSDFGKTINLKKIFTL